MAYDRREWQLYEASILEKVVNICDEHQIRYFLDSGTLLGAVRHKGFIPWDDDIDIAMPINDFKMFCKIAPKELEKVDLFLQTYKTDPLSKNQWAMVRANGTTSMPISSFEWDIHWGVHIDIFPLVGIYNKPLLKKFQFKLYSINSTLLARDYQKLGIEDYQPNKKIKMLYRLPRKILHGIVGLNSLFIDKSFDDSDKIFAKWFAPETRYDKEFYSSTVEVSFEGRNYKAPADYVGELTLMYGDYMKLPPVEERIGHEMFQGETIRDLRKDFREYQAELKYKKEKCEIR